MSGPATDAKKTPTFGTADDGCSCIHCPRFGPDRTEPTGPGFGPMLGRTGPIFTGPRSRPQWTGPEGRTWFGPGPDLKKRGEELEVIWTFADMSHFVILPHHSTKQLHFDGDDDDSTVRVSPRFVSNVM